MRDRPADALPAGLSRRSFITLAGFALAVSAPAARALDAPAGPVVLTVTGRISVTNSPAGADFDMAMLAALPQHSFTTTTPWYSRPRRFTGPLLRDLLASVGAQGTIIRMTALNDYRVDMPFDDAQRHDVIVARLLDNQPLAVRDKGPLFVIYPFDDRPELRGAVHYSRSAWQLRTIQVL